MSKKILQRIKIHLQKGEFRYSIHALQMIEDRIITDEDFRSVGRTVKTCKFQGNGAYKVVGKDENKMDLTVICRLCEKTNLLIITAY